MVQIKRTALFFLVFFFILIIGCTQANGPSKIKESSKTPSQIQSSDVDVSEISDNETGEISNQNVDVSEISDENETMSTEKQSENGAGEMSNQRQNQIVDDSTLDVSEQDDTLVTSEEETE